MFEKHQPYVRRYKLENIIPVSKQDVYNEDKAQLKRYGKFKKIEFNRLNQYRYFEALLETQRILTPSTITGRVSTIDDAFESLPSGTSSCYPDYQKKGSKFVRYRVKELITKWIKNAKQGKIIPIFEDMLKYPVTVFHRFTTKLVRGDGGEVKSNTKIRQVYGVPFAINALETLLFKNAMDASMNQSGVISYGLRRVEQSRRVDMVRSHARFNHRQIMCGDIKSIDASFGLEQIFIPVIHLCNLAKREIWEENITIAYCLYCAFTPVIWMANKLTFMFGGNITGSLLTSYWNSFNLIHAINYAYRTIYGEYPPPESYNVLGDDFIISLNSEEKERFITLMGLFNLKVHSGKSIMVEHTEPILFLGFYWDELGEPTQFDLWYLARICFPERFDDTQGHYRIVQRAASILYQIKGGHEIFTKVIMNSVSELRNLLKLGKDINIRYIDKINTQQYLVIPLRKLQQLKWRAF
jgi:hypothetical protein